MEFSCLSKASSVPSGYILLAFGIGEQHLAGIPPNPILWGPCFQGQGRTSLGIEAACLQTSHPKFSPTIWSPLSWLCLSEPQIPGRGMGGQGSGNFFCKGQEDKLL